VCACGVECPSYHDRGTGTTSGHGMQPTKNTCLQALPDTGTLPIHARSLHACCLLDTPRTCVHAQQVEALCAHEQPHATACRLIDNDIQPPGVLEVVPPKCLPHRTPHHTTPHHTTPHHTEHHTKVPSPCYAPQPPLQLAFTHASACVPLHSTPHPAFLVLTQRRTV